MPSLVANGNSNGVPEVLEKEEQPLKRAEEVDDVSSSAEKPES